MPKYQNFISRLLLLVSVTLALSNISALSQNVAKIDSLKLRLRNATAEQQFDLLQGLFKEYNLSDFETSLNYAREAYKVALAIGDSSKIVEGGRMIAYSLQDLGRNDEAIVILDKSIQIALRNQDRYPQIKPRIKYLMNNIGIAYMSRGNYDSSLKYHFKSLAIREEEGDKRAIGTALNNIGVVYYKLKNYEQSLQNYQRSLELKNELNDKSDLEKIKINIGLCYNNLGKFKEAISAFKEALQLCSVDCPPSPKMQSFYGLGYAFYKENELDSAENYYSRSLEIAKEQSDKQHWIDNLVGLLQIEVERKNYEQGLKYIEEALQFENEVQIPESWLSLYDEAATLYNHLSDFQKQAVYQRKYIQLKDSIFSGELIKNLAKIQASFEERENIKTISEKNRVLQLQNELIARQRTQYFFVVVILVLATGLTLVLILSNQRQRRQAQALNQAKRLISEQNEKLKQANEILDKQVEEKTIDLIKTNDALRQVNSEMDHFIYRTSHDIRGPLVTLKGVCNVAMLDVSDPVARDYFEKLDTTSNKLNIILTRLLLVNRISHWELEPEVIDLAGIIDSVVKQEGERSLPANLTFEYKIDENLVLISDRFLITLIIENLIDNAIKFYNSSGRVSPFVKIEVERAGDKNALIKVIDNGIGIVTDDRDNIFKLFNRASERSETGGIGLYISKLASIKLGGEISLAASSSAGSEFHVLLPADVNPLVVHRKFEEEQLKKEKEIREQKLLKRKGNISI